MQNIVLQRAMDKVDWAILEHLEANGRESFGAIAERVSLSKTPCWTRVQSLERAGAIKGYRHNCRKELDVNKEHPVC